MKILIFWYKKEGSGHICLEPFLNTPSSIRLVYAPKDAVFDGLSESGLIFLGHLYNSGLLTQILEKHQFENYREFLYFDFFFRKKTLFGESLI